MNTQYKDKCLLSDAVMPLVSVVIPTYNRKQYVTDAVFSVLSQTFLDYEVIIIDDGSTDFTKETLSQQFGSLIHYTWQENQGESIARNKGIELTRGKYVAFLDSDDLWLPQKLAIQISFLENNPDYVLVFSSAWQIDEMGKRVGDVIIDQNIDERDLSMESLCVANTLGSAGSTAIIRKKALTQVGGFDSEIRYGEDWDLWLRLRKTGKFHCICQPLAEIRAHRGSQYHYPRPTTIDARLFDSLKILEKTFSNWSGQIDHNLLKQAYAETYGKTAMMNYVIGRLQHGRDQLSKATRLSSENWGSPKIFSERVIRYLREYHLVSGDSVQLIVSRSREILENCPEEILMSKSLSDQTTGTLSAYLIFNSIKQRDYGGAWFAINKTLRFDVSILFDRKILYYGIALIFGENMATRLSNAIPKRLRKN